MIYLIDDKKRRQEIDFGWTSEKLAIYHQFINTIYTIDELECRRKEIFEIDNTIIYHESFLDKTTINSQSEFRRNKLEQFAHDNKDFKLVIFSGSKNTRLLNKNIAYLPVSVLYKNLKIFVENYAKNDINLNYLLYGITPQIESHLLEKLETSLANIEDKPGRIDNQNNLFIPTFEKFISNPIENATIADFYDQENDIEISEFIATYLSNIKYDNIFLPLCYGNTLSDYNGLRLATHIRCTNGLNQLSRIFIYAFVSFDYLINNEYFNILKTKNVYLLPFSKKAFNEVVNIPLEQFMIEELSNQIAQLKLNIPQNYADSHSIANEWAIHRWASTISAESNEIDLILNRINKQLYFKYLSTIFPISNISIIPEDDLKIRFRGSPKILYIDDEANKGWYEILCKILSDINEITEFHYLCEEFNMKSREEIISISLEKIKSVENYFDIVILDFRLHPEDFKETNIQLVTGLRLLKEIKRINPGIQVIVFSATNKIWNFLELQSYGADGFIVKESPENSRDKTFTQHSVNSFIKSFQYTINRIFLKTVFKECNIILTQLNNCNFENGTTYSYFIKDLKKQIILIISASKKINLTDTSTLDIVFLNCYNLLEKFNNHYLKEIDYRFLLGEGEVKMNRYVRNKEQFQIDGLFIRKNMNDKPSWFQTLVGLFIDYFLLSKIDDQEIKYLDKVKEYRNKYIHNNKSNFTQQELLMILSLCVKITSNMKE